MGTAPKNARTVYVAGSRGKTRPHPCGVKSPAASISLKPKAAALVYSLAEKLRITPEEFVSIAARKAEREFEATGGWTTATAPTGGTRRVKDRSASAPELKATDLVSEKTADRIAEMDRVLGLQGRHRTAEVLLADVLEQITSGQNYTMMGAWNFGNPEKAKADLLAMRARWAREDRKTSAKGKEGKAS